MFWSSQGSEPKQVTGQKANEPDHEAPQFLPGGRSFLYARRDIHVFDLARGVETRLTFESRDNTNPIWSADGSQIAYSSNPRGYHEIYVHPSSGIGQQRVLLESNVDQNPLSWSRDGKTLFYNRINPATGRDLWALDVDRGASSLFHEIPARQGYAEISPDSHWVLYRSYETGVSEVYVQPLPPNGQRWAVSNGGSSEAHWRGDGAEILYDCKGSMMAADFRAVGSQAQLGKPKELFGLPPLRALGRNLFAVAPDGQQFLIVTVQPDARPAIVVVVNWPRLLQ